jgi:bacteriorhodopsin
LTANALQKHRSDKEVRQEFAVVLQAISVVYLLYLLVFIVGKQSFSIDTDHWMRLLHLSNFWLSPLQAALIPMLGVVFFSKKKAAQAATEQATPEDE